MLRPSKSDKIIISHIDRRGSGEKRKHDKIITSFRSAGIKQIFSFRRQVLAAKYKQYHIICTLLLSQIQRHIQTLHPCIPLVTILMYTRFLCNYAPYIHRRLQIQNSQMLFPYTLAPVPYRTLLAVDFGLISSISSHFLALRIQIQINPFPLPLGPSILGTAFLPTLLPATSALGTPWMVLGSFIKLTSSWAGIRETTVL